MSESNVRDKPDWIYPPTDAQLVNAALERHCYEFEVGTFGARWRWRQIDRLAILNSESTDWRHRQCLQGSIRYRSITIPQQHIEESLKTGWVFIQTLSELEKCAESPSRSAQFYSHSVGDWIMFKPSDFEERQIKIHREFMAEHRYRCKPATQE